MKKLIVFCLFVVITFSSYAQFIQPPLPHNVYANNDGSFIEEPEFAVAMGVFFGTFALNEVTIHSTSFDEMSTLQQNQITLRNYGVGMLLTGLSFYGVKYLRENKPIKKFMTKHHIKLFK